VRPQIIVFAVRHTSPLHRTTHSRDHQVAAQSPCTFTFLPRDTVADAVGLC